MRARKKDLDIEVVDASVQLASPGDVFGRVEGGEVVLSGWQLLADIKKGGLKEIDDETPSILGCREYILPELGATVYFNNGLKCSPRTRHHFGYFSTGLRRICAGVR